MRVPLDVFCRISLPLQREQAVRQTPVYPFCVHPFSLPLFPTFLFHSALSLTQYVAFASSTMLVEVGLLFYLVFRHFHLRLLSMPGCLSKDVTGALVGSRGLSSSSFIIVRFIVLSMPGPYLFRPLKQLVATLICSRCECQLRCNRSGSMGYLCTGVLNVLSSRELRLY